MNGINKASLNAYFWTLSFLADADRKL